MADITKLFNASVKSVKTRRKDVSSILNSRHTDNGDKSNTTKKNLKIKETDKFAKAAHHLVKSIRELRDFLLSHQRDYLGGLGITNSASFMTEEERDQIDADAQTLMQSCSSAILHLKGEINTSSGSNQLMEHREVVLDLLNSYLKDVCKLYSQQRAIRVKSAVDRKRLFRLNSQAEKLKQPKDRHSSIDHSENAIQRHSSESSRTRLLLEEEKLRSHQEDFSPEETQMFEEENVRLYEELNQVVNEVRQIEGKVIEISKLQEVFSEKILHQASQIEKIHDTAVSTTENVKEGNENIREAIKNSATFRVWILFFLVMCTFSLLFLDWYSQ